MERFCSPQGVFEGSLRFGEINIRSYGVLGSFGVWLDVKVKDLSWQMKGGTSIGDVYDSTNMTLNRSSPEYSVSLLAGVAELFHVFNRVQAGSTI